MGRPPHLHVRVVLWVNKHLLLLDCPPQLHVTGVLEVCVCAQGEGKGEGGE